MSLESVCLKLFIFCGSQDESKAKKEFNKLTASFLLMSEIEGVAYKFHFRTPDGDLQLFLTVLFKAKYEMSSEHRT